MSITKVLVYGIGRLGKAVIKCLSVRDDIEFFHHFYTEGENYHLDFESSGKAVDVLDSVALNSHDEKKQVIKEVSVIVVTLTGEVLEKEIDFLLSFRIPLVICSTNYDKDLIIKKANNAYVSVLMSDNFALPILDFWQRIQSLVDLPEGLSARLRTIESHQPKKKDFSGTAIKTMDFFKNLGFLVNMPSQNDYLLGENSESGSLSAIRNKNDSLLLGVPKEFLDSHGYHRYVFVFDTQGIEEYVQYVHYFYDLFKSLEKSSIPGVLDFQVNLIDNVVEIIHNINGLGIYAQGIAKAIKFLDVNKGEFSGLDLLDV